MPAAVVVVTGGFLLLGRLGDDGFGGEEQAGDRRGVLEGRAGDLGRVNDAGGEHVAPGAVFGVVAERGILRLLDLVDDHRAVDAGVFGDVTGGLFDAAADDVDAECLVAVSLRPSRAAVARISAVPPPGTMPSSIAARVACRASSTSAFRSFISVSVAAPTLIWATPPASLARRSWSFSRSYSLSV